VNRPCVLQRSLGGRTGPPHPRLLWLCEMGKMYSEDSAFTPLFSKAAMTMSSSGNLSRSDHVIEAGFIVFGQLGFLVDQILESGAVVDLRKRLLRPRPQGRKTQLPWRGRNLSFLHSRSQPEQKSLR